MQPSPLSLSDCQLATVMTAAEPLNPHDRDAFLRSVATMLRGERELGDGVVARTCRQLQKEFLRTMPKISAEDSAPRGGLEKRDLGKRSGRGKYW
jgi:hypothetical protein